MSFNSPDALDRHRRKLPEPITKTTRRNPAEQLSVLAYTGLRVVHIPKSQSGELSYDTNHRIKYSKVRPQQWGKINTRKGAGTLFL